MQTFLAPLRILGMNRWLCLVWLCLAPVAWSQTDQEQNLAYQYLNQGDWQKALPFFERFHEQFPQKEKHFKAYIRCLKELNQSSRALEVAKKQERGFPKTALYKAYYYDLLLTEGDQRKAEKVWESWLKDLPPFVQAAEDWGNAFVLLGYNQKAIEIYTVHRKKFGDDVLLHYKLAEAYASEGNYSGVAEELIDVLEKSPAAFGQVQAALNNLLTEEGQDPVNMAIKGALLRKIQSPGDHRNAQELLLWVYRQEADFAAAFIQARALDARYREQGARLMDLGRAAALVQEFSMANKCFNYVVDLGPGNAFYYEARAEKVRNLEAQLSWEGKLNGNELLALADAYRSLLKDLGGAPQSLPLQIRYAKLQAFYLNQAEKAKETLDSLVQNGRGSAQDLAQAKLNLADVQLLLGDLWEPSLLYGQIEKAYPNLLEAQEAKFRNARLAYFRGEFPWALTQVKVLKASTTKLIANDALRLSLLIQDNGGADSSFEALEIFAQAEMAVYRKETKRAQALLDSLKQQFPTHGLVAHSYWLRYEIAKEKQAYEQALSALETLLSFDKNHLLADDALLAAGKLLENQLNQPEKAMEKYRGIILDYPASIWTNEARKRYRLLRGDNKEMGF